MKFGAWITVLLLLLHQGTQAQAPHEKALLWQVAGNGTTAPSYLFGTFHLLCNEDAALGKTFEQKFDASSTLYLEMDMSNLGEQAALLKMMMMPNGTTISSLLTKKEYDSLATLFTRYTGTPFLLVNNIKPLLLSSLLFPSMMNCETSSLELKLTGMAKQKHIPVKGLETMAFQAAMIDSIPYQQQANDLVKTLYSYDSVKEDMMQMVQYYKQRDLPALYNSVLNDTLFNNFEEMMLYRRNTNWAPVLAAAMKQQPCFVAVGAAHLAGDKGLIALLRKKGFTVTPVSY
ncbi:TraB/GumN family protein [Deminuibacter soli]|nr:TraB/GumN family protein [Deminuibacter soli]